VSWSAEYQLHFRTIGFAQAAFEHCKKGIFTIGICALIRCVENMPTNRLFRMILSRGMVMTDIHASSSIPEFTICGMAFDAFDSGHTDEQIVFAEPGQIVTCIECRREIAWCKRYIGYKEPK
jgi:hypothetical protein